MAEDTPTNLRDLHDRLGNQLAGIADGLPQSYRLTLVARYIGRDYADADIIVSDDALADVVDAIGRLTKRPEWRLPTAGGDDGGAHE